MNHFWHSIFFKITFLFLAALLAFFAFSYFFIKDKIEDEQELLNIKYNQIVTTINQIGAFGGGVDIVKKYLRELGFEETQDILKERLQEEDRLPPGFFGTVAKMHKTSNGIYILLESHEEAVLYKDVISHSYESLYFITLVGIIILTFIFILLLRALIPLNTLRAQIATLSSNQSDYIPTKKNPKDEIDLLANEFYKFSNKIKALNESRFLFLRSIMHELKTPITRGRIAAEMLESESQKERLCSVFSRLNELINEFAKLEQLSSKAHKITKTEFLLQHLIEHNEQMLLIDPNTQSPITLQSPYALIKADFELFSLATKNMLDNAIKYSTDGKVCVYTKDDSLCIENLGTPLKHKITEYFKPYFKDSKKSHQGGFGLGMYIIKNTLDNQNFALKYFHEDGKNIFVIKGCVVDNFCELKNHPQKPSIVDKHIL